MRYFRNSISAELVKLRRSPALRFSILLPWLFIALDFTLFRKSMLSMDHLTPDNYRIMALAPLKIIAAFWAGFFNPLLLSVLPSLLLQPEHRAKQWKHIFSQPVPPVFFHLSKLFILMLLVAGSFAIVLIGLWFEWSLLGIFKPLLAIRFPWAAILRALLWLYLGSLPLMALYLWLSTRVDHPALPVGMGLLGVILSISLSRGEMNPNWKKDFIPWVLPYVCVQQAIEQHEARQEVHLVAIPYQAKITDQEKRRRLGSLLWKENLPWVFPPPTPASALAAWSFVCFTILAALNLLDPKRTHY